MRHLAKSSGPGGAARKLAALSLLPLLGGCVAAVALAVPAMTAVGVVSKDKRDDAREAALAGDPAPSPISPALATGPAPAETPVAARVDIPELGGEFEISRLTDLPPPSGLSAAGGPTAPWREFFAYARDRAERVAGGTLSSSAILSPASAGLMLPQRLECARAESAVIVDLDRGADEFVPEAAARAAPGLTAGLARLRAAGVLVMWISRLDANRVEDVAAALQRTGLDPTGRDPILLTLGDGDRKQSLRQQAAESACVIAIAGDRREDFDELFGYLRDPAGAANFDTMIGSGWFLVPDALAAPGESPQEDG
jgi:hypothetical protein